jgi:hypothetical protein
MVDLLGRAGHLQEAENMIQGMPCKPNVDVWTALLGACRIHGNVEMGERIAKRVLELEPKNAEAMCCYQTCMRPLVTWNSVRVLNDRERKEMRRNSQVVPGLK